MMTSISMLEKIKADEPTVSENKKYVVERKPAGLTNKRENMYNIITNS